MHHQARVALGFGDIGPVVVNAVAVEGDCAVAKQQGGIRVYRFLPLGRWGGVGAAELGRGRFAVDDVLFLDQYHAFVLQVLVLDRDEQQRPSAAVLLLGLEDRGDPGHIGFDT